MTRPRFDDEWHELSAGDRSLLRVLALGPITFTDRRQLPESYRRLCHQGLAFQSHNRLTITDLGSEVEELVT